MTLLEFAKSIKNKLTARLAAINAALVNKGQTEVATLYDVPAKIEAIETGIDTSTTNGAESGDILLDKEAFVDGKKVVGSIPTYSNSDLTYSSGKVTGPAGYYNSAISKPISSGALSSDMEFNVSSDGVVTATAKVGTGGYLAKDTSTEDDYQLTTYKSTAYHIPGKTPLAIVPAGYYTTSAVMMAGDANLVASNIKSGVSIFGVTGTYAGGGGMLACITTDGDGDSKYYIGGSYYNCLRLNILESDFPEAAGRTPVYAFVFQSQDDFESSSGGITSMFYDFENYVCLIHAKNDQETPYSYVSPDWITYRVTDESVEFMVDATSSEQRHFNGVYDIWLCY